MITSASRPVVCGYFRLVQAVSDQGETEKLLIILPKTPAVSLFHRFLGNAAAKFYRGARRSRFPMALLPKTVKRRRRQRFLTEYQ